MGEKPSGELKWFDRRRDMDPRTNRRISKSWGFPLRTRARRGQSVGKIGCQVDWPRIVEVI